jgi:hypothetical protein
MHWVLLDDLGVAGHGVKRQIAWESRLPDSGERFDPS